MYIHLYIYIYISCYYGNPAMRIFISLKGPGHLGDMNFDLVDIDDINQVKGHIMHSSNHNANHEFHPKSIIDTKISTQAVQAVCNSYLHARKRNGCAMSSLQGCFVFEEIETSVLIEKVWTFWVDFSHMSQYAR